MTRPFRFPAACLAVAAILVTGGPAVAFAGREIPDKAAKVKPAKSHKVKNISGAGLVGEKIKQSGKQKFHDHEKFSATVDVRSGKIAAVEVKHLVRGDVAVTKYKTMKQIGRVPAGGVYFASLGLAKDAYVGTRWIGYAYRDDSDDEIIYWFAYDMTLGGDTGAIEYHPVP